MNEKINLEIALQCIQYHGIMFECQFLNDFLDNQEYLAFLENYNIYFKQDSEVDIFDVVDELRRHIASLPKIVPSKSEEESAEILLFAFSRKAIFSLEDSGLLTISKNKPFYLTDQYITLSFISDIVISKVSFKTLAKISEDNKFSLSDFRIHKSRLNEVAKVLAKTLKYKQSYLKTVLAHRLSGTYKAKIGMGLTWNERGI